MYNACAYRENGKEGGELCGAETRVYDTVCDTVGMSRWSDDGLFICMTREAQQKAAATWTSCYGRIGYMHMPILYRGSTGTVRVP